MRVKKPTLLCGLFYVLQTFFPVTQSYKSQEQRVPSQAGDPVLFLEKCLFNFLLQTFDGDISAFPNHFITLLSPVIIAFPLTSNLIFCAI